MSEELQHPDFKNAFEENKAPPPTKISCGVCGESEQLDSTVVEGVVLRRCRTCKAEWNSGGLGRPPDLDKGELPPSPGLKVHPDSLPNSRDNGPSVYSDFRTYGQDTPIFGDYDE